MDPHTRNQSVDLDFARIYGSIRPSRAAADSSLSRDGDRNRNKRSRRYSNAIKRVKERVSGEGDDLSFVYVISPPPQSTLATTAPQASKC